MNRRNPYQSWERHHLGNNASDLLHWFEKEQPVVGGFDTETTGLHIKKDKPFLISFGWLLPGRARGRVFTFHPTRSNMQMFFQVAKKLRIFAAWNIKFDLHMLTNIGFPYEHPNVFEAKALARAASEAVSYREGGESLKLKDFATKYVHPSAGDSERTIKNIQGKLNINRTAPLRAALKAHGFKWSEFNEIINDVCYGPEYLPDEVREIYEDWKQDYPEPTYQDIYHANPEAMIRYAQDDIISLLEAVRICIPIVKVREQVEIVKRENQLILPLYRIERAGIKTNSTYLYQSRSRMKEFIRNKRYQLEQIAGEPLKPGQNQRIKQIFAEKMGLELPNTQESTLRKIAHTSGNAAEMAQIIIQLRTVEKWIATYCDRIIEGSEYDGRYYGSFDSAGTVSGRFSSPLQQFPRDPLIIDGEELFNPRKAFEPTDKGKHYGFNSIVYFDWSQIELRSQADYCIRVMGGDQNLSRAFMPFGCRDRQGNLYNFRDPAKRAEWNKKEWFLPDGTKWEPTDLHSMTAHETLVGMGYICHKKFEHYEAPPDLPPEVTDVFGKVITKENWKQIRSRGKTFNFMANYGGTKKAAMNSMEIPEMAAEALVRGFNNAYPGVRVYQQAVEKAHARKGYVQNLYGRRYYMRNRRWAYKLANYCVQGTCADLAKDCILKIDELLRKTNAKSRMILLVHDEIQVELWAGEEWLIPHIKQIMEDHPQFLVPIVCDVEVTRTNWAEKKPYEEEMEVATG